ncbi:hypothetical protein ykris0001_32910 [Yersinia kristensenii ATCC 33638]|nr:hypothetical protein ykris0001_32910 [Yersinia kristensenii ATCC 33638]
MGLLIEIPVYWRIIRACGGNLAFNWRYYLSNSHNSSITQ